MKQIIYILTLIFVILTGCTTNRKNYIIFIDNSVSVNETTVNKYIDIIKESILPYLGTEDKLTIQFIDKCTATMPERIYSLNLAELNFKNISDGLNNEKDSINSRKKSFIRDSVKSYIKQIILQKRIERKNCGNYTDIINALYEGSNLLSNKRNYDGVTEKMFNEAKGEENYEYENCIVIFSDMVNESFEKDFNFTNMHLMKEKQIEDKIDYLMKHNKIPDLNNTDVFIYGTTATKEGKFANKQVENIRLFWELYFKNSGATLKAYGFDTETEIKNYLLTNR